VPKILYIVSVRKNQDKIAERLYKRKGPVRCGAFPDRYAGDRNQNNEDYLHRSRSPKFTQGDCNV
jgi:hypothetical protein